MPTVYFSLGSNLGNKRDNLTRAIEMINERIGDVVRQSSFYESEAWSFSSKNRFVNVCIACLTDYKPRDILKETQLIERELGRLRKSTNRQYHDRTIDIDLLLYDNVCIDTPDLIIPHPLMMERDFVMIPLKEILPDAEIIVGRLLSRRLQR